MPDTRWAGLGDPSRAVALEVLRHGPLSRSELARRLDLSAGSLTRLSRPLIESGILVEPDEPHATAAGRPARPLVVATGDDHFIGVRLTGEHAWAVLTNLRAEPLAHLEAPLASHDPHEVVETVASLTRQLTGGAGTITGLGLGLGGQVVADGIVSRAPYLGWTDVPLGPALSTATGLPVTVENDVVALTTAENWFGAGRRERSLAVVTIGTGIGCGLIYGGNVVTGAAAGLGLVAHLPLGLPGPVCWEGHRGCAAAVLADGCILAQASSTLQRRVDHDELVDLVITGEHAGVNRIAEDVAVGLGRLIAIVTNVSLAPLVVISGEGLVLAELLQHRVRREVAAYRDHDAPQVELVFQPSAGSRWARGAAASAIQQYVSPGTEPTIRPR